MMKIFRMLGRSIRDAFKSVFRNFSLSLASISCITITLVIVAVSIIASFNVENFAKEIESDLTVVAFLKSDVEEKDIEDLTTEIKNMANVESVEFQGRESIKEEMSKESDAFNSVMSEWSKEETP